MILVVVISDFIDAMVGNWPISDKRPGAKNVCFLDVGFALFTPDPAQINWSALRDRIAESMESWSERHSWGWWNREVGARWIPRGARSRIGVKFAATAAATPCAQTLKITSSLFPSEEKTGKDKFRGRAREATNRKKKQSATLDRNRRSHGKRPHRGDKDIADHAIGRLWGAAQRRQHESMEKVSARVSSHFLLSFEGVSCVQRVAAPSAINRRQWRQDYDPKTEDLEGAKNGIEAYRRFLLTQWQADEIADAAAQGASIRGAQEGGFDAAPLDHAAEPKPAAKKSARRV